MEAVLSKASWTYAVELIVVVVFRLKRDWWTGRHGRVGSGLEGVVETNLAIRLQLKVSGGTLARPSPER